jgi:hypothetical protein
MKNIELSQYEIAVGQQYSIKINGKLKFFVDSAPLEIFDDYFIRKPNSQEVIYSIYEKARIFNAKYIIKDRINNKNYFFTTKSFWMNSYTCNGNDTNTYFFYEHPKLMYSIYKNDNIIAYGKRDKYTFLQGDYYNIKTNDIEDTLLIASMFVCIDNYRSDKGSLFGGMRSLFKINFGVINEEVPFCGEIKL